MMECSLWRYQSYLASHAWSFITPPFLNSTRPTPTCAPILYPTRPSLFHQQTPCLHSLRLSPLCSTRVCSLLLPFSCTANTSSSWKIPVARQFNVFSSGLAQLSVSTSHIRFITCHNCLCFFNTPTNCEVHGKRMVSFSERSPQCLVHGRCQRALSERMKEQTDEGRMNACV